MESVFITEQVQICSLMKFSLTRNVHNEKNFMLFLSAETYQYLLEQIFLAKVKKILHLLISSLSFLSQANTLSDCRKY